MCTKCKSIKSTEEFHNNKSKPDGKCLWCKTCACKNSRNWWAKLPDDYVKNAKKRYNDNNRDYVNSYNRSLYQKHKDKAHARSKKYALLKTQSCPTWLTKEQHSDITKMYALSKKLSKIFGVKYHVDHIIPLKGSNVCGLHVPWNLQILEAKLNLKKSNRLKEE